jgi:hypothetical protein
MQPLLQWKSIEYYIIWVCVYSLRYPVSNAHERYFLLWPAYLQYFSTLSHKRHDFRKKLLNIKYVFLVSSFSKTFVWNISHSKKNGVRYDQKCILIFMLSNRHFCQILMNLEFYRQIFGKLHLWNFIRIRLAGAEFPHAERRTNGTTDGQIRRS